MLTTVVAAPSQLLRRPPAARLHLDYLDGFRALLALFVVLHHIPYFRMPSKPGTEWSMTLWLHYGHLAVDAFIVISGFCLILPVAQTGELKGGALAFFKRRAHRILPPFYAALFFSIFVDILVNHFGHQPVKFIITPKSLLTNIFLLQDFFPQYSLNWVFWSVAVEWKIYFLFPLIIAILQKGGKLAAVLFAGVAGYGTMAALHWLRPQLSLDEVCPWYLLLFTMGVCAGKTAMEQREVAINQQTMKKWSGLLLLAFLMIVIVLKAFPLRYETGYSAYAKHFPIIDPCVGFFAALLLLVLSFSQAPVGIQAIKRFLNWAPLVRIGTFSYSIYLLQWPLILIIRSSLDHFAPQHTDLLLPQLLRMALIVALFIPFGIGSAYLFFLKFEKPFLNSRKPEPALHLSSPPAPVK